MPNGDLLADKDFYVDTNRIEYQWSMRNSHQHNSYEIYYLLDGNRIIFVNDKVYNLCAGDIVLIRPNVFHRTFNNGIHERVNIVFKDKVMDKYFSRISSDYLLACFNEEFIRLSNHENESFMKLYLTLKEEYEKNAPFFLTLAQLLQLLKDAAKRQKREPAALYDTRSKSSQRVVSIISYITSHYSRIGSIDEIATACYLNKSYMCRIFKKATGMTIFEYINSVKIQRACDMLRTSNESVIDIAIKCGFSSASYFSYAFREIMDCSPSQFRIQQQA